MIYRQHITLLFSGPPHYQCKHEKPTFNVVGFVPLPCHISANCLTTQEFEIRHSSILFLVLSRPTVQF